MEHLKIWLDEINNLSYTELKKYNDYISKANDISSIEKYIKMAIIFFKIEKLSMATKYFQLAYNTYTLNQKISALENEKWFNILKAVYYDWFLVEIGNGGGDGSEIICGCCCGGSILASCCLWCCFGGDAKAFDNCICNCCENGGKGCCCLGTDNFCYRCCTCH